jgi:hypothetical protein
MLRGSFFVDEGALYRVWTVEADVLAQGMNTGTVYRSPATRVEVTGKERSHGGRVGRGQRAILHLDTGEGVSALRGVWREDS